MQVCGYELAFASDTSKPLIWYNFKYDTLYLEYMWPEIARRLQSEDLIRVERLVIPRNSALERQMTQLVPIFGHVKELLLSMQFNDEDTGHQGDFSDDIEGDLAGYLECDFPELISDQKFFRYTKCRVSDYYDGFLSRISAYRKENGASYDGFYSWESQKIEDLLQMKKGASTAWTVPKMKHVYLVTRYQAGKILAFRERFRAEMRERERLENEEGVQQISDAPFEDECEVMAEDPDW